MEEGRRFRERSSEYLYSQRIQVTASKKPCDNNGKLELVNEYSRVVKRR